MARPRVLLTGFGPFPGVAENPSGWLAETLAACEQSHDLEFHGQVLPTEWEAVAALAPHLNQTVQPHVMIHFGVNRTANGLSIERSAHNRAVPDIDARGALPGSSAISPNGQDRLDTEVPVDTLAARLRTRGHVAATSHSCGRYICNFLYYRSLEWAKAQSRDALFVHVPLLASQGGPVGEEELLDAAQETLRFVLDVTTDPARRVPAALTGEAS